MRLRTIVIFGIGYIVGSRAGNDRYEKLADGVRRVADSDVVRGYVERAFDLARDRLDEDSELEDDELDDEDDREIEDSELEDEELDDEDETEDDDERVGASSGSGRRRSNRSR